MTTMHPSTNYASDNDPFINLIVSACESEEVRKQILVILNLDSFNRKSLLNTLIDTMRLEGAAKNLLEAMSMLEDDAIAQQALVVIQEHSKSPQVSWKIKVMILVILGLVGALGIYFGTNHDSVVDLLDDAQKAYDQKNFQEASELYREAAAEGNAWAQFQLGLLHFRGHLGEVDHQKAFGFFSLAAEQDLKTAQFWLASLYEEGQGIPKNLPKAIEWYEKAALQGETRAELKLAVLFFNGKGVSTDHQKSFSWSKQAAWQGSAFAQNLMALHFRLGLGTKKDLEKAYEWYEISTLNGYHQAKTEQEEFSKELTPQQISHAETNAKNWISKNQP